MEGGRHGKICDLTSTISSDKPESKMLESQGPSDFSSSATDFRAKYVGYLMTVYMWYLESLTSRRVAEYMLLVTGKCPQECDPKGESNGGSNADSHQSRVVRTVAPANPLLQAEAVWKARARSRNQNYSASGNSANHHVAKTESAEGTGSRSQNASSPKVSGGQQEYHRKKHRPLSVLFIDPQLTSSSDYQSLMTLQGFKSLFGRHVDVMFPVRQIYDWERKFFLEEVKLKRISI
jgi:hypothetical protein